MAITARCADATSEPTWRNGRIIFWDVTCPECGTIATGQTLNDIIDVEYAHALAGQALITEPPTRHKLNINFSL
jgi:hypothetical protein